jgi:hypothetical protein
MYEPATLIPRHSMCNVPIAIHLFGDPLESMCWIMGRLVEALSPPSLMAMSINRYTIKIHGIFTTLLWPWKHLKTTSLH